MTDDKTMLPAIIADRMQELNDSVATINQQIEQHQKRLNDLARERDLMYQTVTMLRDAGWGPPSAANDPPPPSPPQLLPDPSPAPRERFLRYDIIDLIQRGIRNEDEIFRELKRHRDVNRRQRDNALKQLFARGIIRRDARGEFRLVEEQSSPAIPAIVDEPAPEPKPDSNRGQEPGVRSQEPGVRSQEPGVRSQEPGVRSQEPTTEPLHSAPNTAAAPVVQLESVAKHGTHNQMREKILWLFDHRASKTGMYSVDTMQKALAGQHVTASVADVREAFGGLQDDNLIKEGHAPGWWMRVRDEPPGMARKGPH